MKTLWRTGVLTSGGVVFVVIALAAYVVQVVRSPRVSWRADCQMAWSTIIEPDIFFVAVVTMLGVGLGSVFWGPRSHLLLTATAPGARVAAIAGSTLTLVAVAFLPGVTLALARTAAAGGPACVSAAALHLFAAMALGLGVGMAAARRLNAPLAAVVSLAVVGLLYAVVPALADRKLLNVGVTPLPMMDQQRSWAYALWMAVALAVLTLLLVASVVAGRHLRFVVLGLVVTLLAVGVLPAPTSIVNYRLEDRVCEDLTAGKRFCVPRSYSWLARPGAQMADRMLVAGVARGLDTDLLPGRFELGQFATTSGPETSQMTLSSEFASLGRLPATEVGGLLATPSWCPAMRAPIAPMALLRQTGVLAVWFAVQSGDIEASDAPSRVASGDIDPSKLTIGQVNAGFRAARACSAATWAQ